jgi:hypothetical protein
MTSRLTLCLVGFDTYSGMSRTHAGTLRAESEPILSLQASLEDMATHWFNMKVTASQS